MDSQSELSWTLLSTCGHHVKGDVGASVAEVAGRAKVLAKAHAADDIQGDSQSGIVQIHRCTALLLQDADQLPVDLHHVPKALPAQQALLLRVDGPTLSLISAPCHVLLAPGICILSFATVTGALSERVT